MLQVASPPPPLLSPCGVANPFDPIAYVAHVRNNGLGIHASHRDGERRLSWDIRNADVALHHHPDPRLNISADRVNEVLVWETLRAEAYLAACRQCRLVVYPWASGYVVTHGEDEDSDDRDYSAGTMRMLEHPDGRAHKDCRKGLLFHVLCGQFGVDPDDPALRGKVIARLEADRVPA